MYKLSQKTITTIALTTLFYTFCLSQNYIEMIEQDTFPVEQIQASANSYFENNDKGKGSGYKQWKRWEYEALRMTDENGYLISTAYYYDEMARYNAFLNQQPNTQFESCTGDWTALGPTDIPKLYRGITGIGRLTSIAIDPNKPDHILVGSQTGGVWKSEDAGQSWLPISDFLVNLRVYSLAIDPNDSNIYYWGQSNGLIYKSVNGGRTWGKLEFEGWGLINKILINPTNNQELWISDSNFGIFHSLDAGENWNRSLEGYCSDIEIHPTNPNIIYASGRSLWRSTDAGNTFVMLDFPSSNNQFLSIAVSPSAPNNLYVLQNYGKRFEGLYISHNSGETFTKKDQGNINLLGYNPNGRDQIGQAPRNMDIAVSPTDSNEIFVAGINIWRSVNAAESFDILSYYRYDTYPTLAYNHADIEVLQYNNNKLFIASDGGLSVMEDPSTTMFDNLTITDLSKGLNIHQIYRIGVAQSESLLVSVGAQDNGSSILNQDTWRNFSGGDGTETLFINNEEKTLFSSSQNGSFYYSKDLGLTTKAVVGTSILGLSGHWVTPFEKDPNDLNTIYVAYDSIYRSQDLGEHFESISQDFHASHFKVAPTGSDTIYAAAGPYLYRTTDGGATEWDLVLSQNINRSRINAIAIHPTNAKLVALAIAGAKSVLLTRDAGENWEAWDEDLPTFQALSIVWQNNDLEALYLGMSAGIYYSDINNRSWKPFNNGLPNIKINELEINTITNEIFAGTYGRGLWVSPLCNQVTSSTQLIVERAVVIQPNPIYKGQNIIIETKGFNQVELRLFNQFGILVHRDLTADLITNYQINTNNMDPGIYYLNIKNAFGIFNKKLLIL